MKTIYIKIISNFIFLIGFISCKSQTLPLNTFMDNIPANAYVKDLNNELNPYEGTYKANYQGNEITLFITKVENRLEERAKKKFYRDALVVKYIVRNSSGSVLQDTQNNTAPKIRLYSIRTRPAQNTVILIYGGTNCGVGWGDVFLKKINANQISWEYRPDSIITDNETCPPETDINVYLPVAKDLIFTKQ